MRKPLKIHFWLMILSIYTGHAYGWDTSNISPEELVRLPMYCQVHSWIMGSSPAAPMRGRTEEQRKAEFNRWRQILGWENGYIHTHHYCWGQAKLNRYYRHLNDPDKNSYLDFAVEDVTYAINNAPKTYSLQPEMLTFRAKLLIMLNKPTEAIKDLTTALKLNPAYERAYISLADLYQKHGQNDVAKTILQHGLKVVPNSKSLKQQLAHSAEAPRPPAPAAPNIAIPPTP